VDNVEVDERLVRSLLREQHPDLAGLRLDPVAGGWVNQLWRLGDKLAVRLPRTPRAASLLRNEQRWLPVLASRLPLPVPTPVRIGEPSACFPGRGPSPPGFQASLATAPRSAAATMQPKSLASFLRALHGNAPAEAPVSHSRGVSLGALTHEFERKFRAVASCGVAADIRAVWDDAVAARLGRACGAGPCIPVCWTLRWDNPVQVPGAWQLVNSESLLPRPTGPRLGSAHLASLT